MQLLPVGPGVRGDHDVDRRRGVERDVGGGPAPTEAPSDGRRQKAGTARTWYGTRGETRTRL
jgi:hypothetical protein